MSLRSHHRVLGNRDIGEGGTGGTGGGVRRKRKDGEQLIPGKGEASDESTVSLFPPLWRPEAILSQSHRAKGQEG